MSDLIKVELIESTADRYANSAEKCSKVGDFAARDTFLFKERALRDLLSAAPVEKTGEGDEGVDERGSTPEAGGREGRKEFAADCHETGGSGLKEIWDKTEQTQKASETPNATAQSDANARPASGSVDSEPKSNSGIATSASDGFVSAGGANTKPGSRTESRSDAPANEKTARSAPPNPPDSIVSVPDREQTVVPLDTEPGER